MPALTYRRPKLYAFPCALTSSVCLVSNSLKVGSATPQSTNTAPPGQVPGQCPSHPLGGLPTRLTPVAAVGKIAWAA